MEGKVWNDPLDRTFDDFVLGEVVLTRGRTVDIGDLTAFAGLTGDHYPLHTDEEYCKGTRFGTRIAHGPLIFAFAVGLVGMTGFYGNAIVALVEVDSSEHALIARFNADGSLDRSFDTDGVIEIQIPDHFYDYMEDEQLNLRHLEKSDTAASPPRATTSATKQAAALCRSRLR